MPRPHKPVLLHKFDPLAMDWITQRLPELYPTLRKAAVFINATNLVPEKDIYDYYLSFSDSERKIRLSTYKNHILIDRVSKRY